MLNDSCSSNENGNPIYTFDKIVSGGFNQADERFGEIAGIQCGMNVLSALCYSAVKKVSIWKTLDLDYVITNGSAHYRKYKFNSILALDELPLNVNIFDEPITLVRISGLIYSLYESKADHYSKVLGNEFASLIRDSKGAALVIRGITYCIVKESTNYYVFDSHAHSNIDGSSILALTVTTLF